MRTSDLAILIATALSGCGNADRLQDASILHVDDETLTPTIESSKGFLLAHFSSYDPNCGYCIGSNTEVAALSRRYGVSIARLTWEPWQSLETSSDLREEYWIRGLPTMILYKDGKELWRGTGNTEEHFDKLAALLDD